MALARIEVVDSLLRTCDLVELHYRIIAEDLSLGHDVEVKFVPVLVLLAWVRAPLLITIEWAEVCNHDDDALALFASGSASRARRIALRRQTVTLSATAAAPAPASLVKERLATGSRVDARRNAELGKVVSLGALEKRW